MASALAGVGNGDRDHVRATLVDVIDIGPVRRGGCSDGFVRGPFPVARPVTGLLDGAMDRALVLGYTKIGSGLRRRWWPADRSPICCSANGLL